MIMASCPAQVERPAPGPGEVDDRRAWSPGNLPGRGPAGAVERGLNDQWPGSTGIILATQRILLFRFASGGECSGSAHKIATIFPWSPITYGMGSGSGWNPARPRPGESVALSRPGTVLSPLGLGWRARPLRWCVLMASRSLMGDQRSTLRPLSVQRGSVRRHASRAERTPAATAAPRGRRGKLDSICVPLACCRSPSR